MGRTLRSTKANMKSVSLKNKSKMISRSWSPKEDTILKDYIMKYRIGRSWKALPKNTGLQRSSRSCRARWLNYLQPGIKLGGFTEEEDNIIYTLHSKIGSRWAVIAAQLPGRSDQAVKNHWNIRLRRKALLARTNEFESNSETVPPTCASSGPVADSVKSSSVPTLPRAVELIEPAPDFSDIVNWYVMTPPRDIWEATCYGPTVDSFDDDGFGFGFF